jgi:D-aspartate ligase
MPGRRRTAEVDGIVAKAATILIGSGRGALAAVRALGMRGVEVWVAAPRPVPPSVSRYARGLVRTPSADEDLTGYIDALTEIAVRFPTPPVLLPSDDISVEVVARHWDRLGARYRLIGPPPTVAGVILDKATQYRAVSAAGIPVPRTWVYDDPADSARIVREARFPLLVKPRASQRFFMANRLKALRVDTPAELDRVLGRFSDHMLIQELVPGDVETGFEFTSFVDAGGRVTNSVVLRKRDVYPRPFGNTIAVETVIEPQVEALGLRVLEALAYRGISQSEFKRDPATGHYFFIEINPRIVNNTGIDTAAGADTVYAAYAQAAGLPFERGARRPARTVWFCPELRLPYSKALAPPAPLADSLPGPTRYVTDLFWPSDPAPLFHKAYDALRARVVRMVRQRRCARRGRGPPVSRNDVV